MPGWRLLAQAGARVLGCGARGLGADPGLERRISCSLLEISTARVVLGGMNIFLKKISPLLSNWSPMKIKPS
uniref:Mitochondrial ribosomal protein L3 n=1 Tax=Mus musculus TaxID=10090 RepID=A0A087WQU4_MOUSE